MEIPAVTASPSAPLRQRLLRTLRLPLFSLGLAACAGILLADNVQLTPLRWLAPAVVFIVLLLLRRTLPCAWLACAAVFAFLHAANDLDPLRLAMEARLKPGGAAPAEFTGMIEDEPEPDATGTGVMFPLRLESLDCAALIPPGAAAGRRLYVRARDFSVRLHYGDRIRLSGLLRRSAPPRNPGEFDFPYFLRRQSLSGEVETSGNYDQLDILARDTGHPVVTAAQHSREWIGRAVTREIEDDPAIAATVRAMVLGTREKTPQEIEDAFVASGAMHVFAVSGLHVAMFGAIIWTLLRSLRVPRGVVVLLIIPIVFFYVFVTGLRPSAWRAAIMAAAFLLGQLADRKASLFNSLGAAALLLMGADTQCLFQPGFTLSFGVLLAIGAFYPQTRRWLDKIHTPDPFLPRQLYSWRYKAFLAAWGWTADSLALSTAATIGSTALMIHYFNLLTPAGIIANLFLVFLSLCILSVACLSLLAALIHWPLTQVIANHLNILLASLMVGLAKIFAAMPFGHIRCEPSRLFRGNPCELTVLHLDNGGAAIHLDTPGGRHWMLDCGGLRHYLRTVRPHLTRTPVNKLDGLILTHQDADHTGAVGQLRLHFPPRAEPRFTAGQELTPEPGLRLRCLFPPPGYTAPTADDQCAVFLLECRGTRILLMGDAGFATEQALLEGGEDLRAHILIKDHHARDYSGTPEFLNAVRPHTLIHTGNPASSDQPHPVWWKQIAAAKNITILDQSRTGAITIHISEEQTRLHSFLQGPLHTILRNP